MSRAHATLLVGGTGRTGARVLEQLLSRGVSVRAIVRSADRLPRSAAQDLRFEVVVADLLSLSDETLVVRSRLRRGDLVVTYSLFSRGSSVRRATSSRRPPRGSGRAIEAAQPISAVKFILMSSVSVNQPAGRDTRRGAFEGGASGYSAGRSRLRRTTRRRPTSSATASVPPVRSSSGSPFARTHCGKATSSDTRYTRAS